MKKLDYLVSPEDIIFSYNDIPFIKNSRRNPFVYAVVENEENTKKIALYDYKIKKFTNEYCKIEFSCEDLSVICELTCTNKTIGVEIKKSDNIKKLCFNLFKENGERIHGLCVDDNKNKSKKYAKIIKKANHDKKMAFFLENKYFLENLNVLDYKIEDNDNISVYSEQSKIKFNLIFNPNIHVAANGENKNSEHIKKYLNKTPVFIKDDNFSPEKTEKFENKYGIKADGIILTDQKYNLSETKKTITEIHNYGREIIFAFKAEIKDIEEFKPKNLQICEKTKNGYKINFKSDEARRIYFNHIRKFLDVGADGIYFENDFDKEDVYLIHKQLKILVNEYPLISVFHEKISELNDDFGYYIINNKHLLNNFALFKDKYVYSGENRIGYVIKKPNKKDYGTEFSAIVYDIKKIGFKEKLKLFFKNVKNCFKKLKNRVFSTENDLI